MRVELLSGLVAGVLLAALPSSNNYELHNYGFGSGGTSNSSSTNYSLEGTTGEVGGSQSGSTNFRLRPGNSNTQQSYVPTATLDNPANYYNKLHFAINPGDNPSTAKYSIAISTDNFATTQYVQSDNTVGPSRGLEDYQTYAAWGSGSGQLITGLTYSTTYKIKVNSTQGNFTETEYGPEATAATVAPSITFDIDIASGDSDSNPPYDVSLGNLLPATVIDAPDKIWVDLETNADSGAKVYISSANGGLTSAVKSYTINSATANLAGATTGYGAQGSTATESSGGPLSIVSPYNGAGQNVGVLDSLIREIFSTSSPITAGRGSLILKAKSSAQTPSSDDYEDTVTLTAAASF